VAENMMTVDTETAVKVLRLIDALDELDDTQNVYTNCDISDEAAEKYSKQA
jgi:transcriptional/translational regulatory protein YebC/TACO1